MTDRYLDWVNRPIGARLAKLLGLPRPAPLRRRAQGEAWGDWRLMGDNGQFGAAIANALDTLPVTLLHGDRDPQRKLSALVFDASGLRDPTSLSALHRQMREPLRQLLPGARVLVVGHLPERCAAPAARAAQRALEGFVRALAKELRRGATANLIIADPDCDGELASPLRFFGSVRSAFVTGQVVRVHPGVSAPATSTDPARPLADQRALVTGAARGIGAAIAERLAADGATVIGLDVPAAETALRERMEQLGGQALCLDITDPTAPDAISDALLAAGGADIVVHNAGVTRDKRLVNMRDAQWDLTLSINLAAPLQITDTLRERGALRPGARLVGVASISGIAGNAGQTNYGASKAGVIGMVDALAPALAAEGMRINAVAPGFIETEMTAAIPFAIRQAGRRMSSLGQGGLPDDVAETIAWLADPANTGVNGQTLRVCGQNLIGA